MRDVKNVGVILPTDLTDTELCRLTQGLASIVGFEFTVVSHDVLIKIPRKQMIVFPYSLASMCMPNMEKLANLSSHLFL